MDLFDNINEQEIRGNGKKNNNKNMLKIIVIAIVLITIIIVAILGIMMYLQSKTLKFYVDGANTAFSSEYFVTSEDGEFSVSIKDLAKSLGYEYFNGEYGTTSEDTTKGYIKSEEEVTSFEVNSNKIYKLSTASNADYEYIYLDKGVKLINGKLYTTKAGAEKIFNITMSTSETSIQTFSLDYLTTYYTSLVSKYGYKQINEEFNNKKSMLDGMIIAEKEDRKMGVIGLDGKEIIGAKYDNISYIPTTKDFFVKLSNKVGMVNSEGKTKINLLYDEIKILDKDLNLYIVKTNNKYGVLNQNGDTVLYLEFDEIGIDSSLYKTENIKNNYLLFDNAIPVRKDKKWGLYNKNGKEVLPVEYDGIGCVVGTSNNKSANNVAIVEDYEAIVISKDKKYGIINSVGKQYIPCALDTVYSIISSGKTTYKIEGVQNGQSFSYDLDKYFEAINVQKVNKNTEANNDNVQQINNGNTLTNSTTNTETQNTTNQVNETNTTNEVQITNNTQPTE